MANTTKQMSLIAELTARTQDGSLAWEKTSERGTYMVALPDYAIRITGGQTPINDAYRLRVFNSVGTVTADIASDSPTSITPPGDLPHLESRSQMAELYKEARRVAESGDDTSIDALLAELRQLGSKDAKAS